LWSSLLRKSKLYKYRTLFKVLFWLALSVAYIAAVLPQELAPTIGTLSDKAHHILAFLVLGILIRLAYAIDYWAALLWLLGFGVFIEISQYFVEGRCSEINDILADSIGSFIGLKLSKYLRKII